MATGSSLTKGVRRTGGRNKSQLECPSPDCNLNFNSRKGNNQGDGDSDPTSFTSSMHGSTTSSTPSIDRYSSGMEEKNRRKKTLDNSNSKKRTGFWSFRTQKTTPQSPALNSPDDTSAAALRPSPAKVSNSSPVLKITRSGSLRSLKIVRNKSRSSSDTKSSKTKDLSNRATFTSTLKDSKFPEMESEEIVPAAKVCPYQHCSLHGHHHHHQEPPVERFSFLKRRSSKDQKGVNPNPFAKKTEDKVTKKGSDVGSKTKKNEKVIKKEVDFAIELCAKTRSRRFLESSSGLDDAIGADYMFGINGDNWNEVQNPKMDNQESSNYIDNQMKKQGSINSNQMSMWRLIQRRMGSDFVAKFGSEFDQEVIDAVNQENENRKKFVIKTVREAIEKILLPEVQDNQSITYEVIPEEKMLDLAINEVSGTEEGKPDSWSHVKKVILLRRFIAELEKVKKFDPNKFKLIPLIPESEAETVSLRPQRVGDKKNSDDWMLDYALQQVVSQLSPNQKRKVALLIKAFESVAPKLDDSKELSFTEENGDYKDFDEKGVDEMKSEKEKYITMWHMICQHVVTDITNKVGCELLCDGDDEQEVKDETIDNEFSQRDADILIRQSVNEILLPKVQEDASLEMKEVDGGESQNQLIPKNWNKLRTLRRSIKDLESFRKPKSETLRESVFQKEQEGEQVDLRRQMSREKTKAEQWMVDYAVQHIVTKLTPARKKRVSMLVEAFEAVIPLPQT